MSQLEMRVACSSSRSRRFSFLVVLLLFASWGLIPERVSADDPRLKTMFDAIGRVDHTRLGFTAIPIDAQVRVEWHPMFDKAYDVMLHIDGKTSRTVAFKRTAQDYEWIAEQEILKGADELTLGDVDPYLNKWAVHRFECTQNDAVRL